jgi:hypothetical protein
LQKLLQQQKEARQVKEEETKWKVAYPTGS